jgi:ribose 5-phosphate isomerase B
VSRRVVTEADIRSAGPSRSVDVSGAVVTPSARDLAKQLGVALTNSEQTGRRAGGQEGGKSADQSLPVRPSARLPVCLGSDHGGFPMKEALKKTLGELGFEVIDAGTTSSEAVDYPDFAVAVARAVADGKAWRGIMVDGAGIGSSMAANKVKGVRAALCYDITTASNAREHNDANVLTLGGTLIGQRLAGDIVKTFLTTDFGGGRHQSRVDKINALDRAGHS